MKLDEALAAFIALPLDRKIALLQWIQDNLIPQSTINPLHSSYGIKELIVLPNEMSSSFTNDEFKGAMLVAGYRIKDENELNWTFNLSRKSPAFRQE